MKAEKSRKSTGFPRTRYVLKTFPSDLARERWRLAQIFGSASESKPADGMPALPGLQSRHANLKSQRFAISHALRVWFAALVFALVSLTRGADVVSIWGGAREAIILKSDGTVWTWGANYYGKLGVGLGPTALTNMSVPVEVHGPGNVSYLNSISIIMGGEMHNVAIKSDGTVWSWGQNTYGQLGDGTTNDAWTPIQTGLGAVPPLTSVIKLGGRPYFTLAVKSDGSVWAWGMNRYGQMGNGTVNPLPGPQVTVPVMVSNSAPGGPINNPLQVTCGYQFGAALTTNGTVWTWGSGTHGELGQGAITSTNYPAPVPGLTNIIAISGGWFHILALRSDGTVWAWGNNSNGELGDGTTVNRSTPVQVLNVSNIISVSGGDSHSTALAADGTVWKWGLNDLGELGNGTTNAVANPFPAEILTDKFGAGFSNVVMAAARDYHNIAVKADGSVWMWGANDQGQCGESTTNNDCWRPVPVVGLGPRVGLPLNVAASAQPGYADLTWASTTGAYFSVECSTNLEQGFTGVWQSNILATPPTNVVTVSMTNSQGYYRLRF
jgi:alpha-tubulin suppressor-like RCC1 family protein